MASGPRKLAETLRGFKGIADLAGNGERFGVRNSGATACRRALTGEAVRNLVNQPVGWEKP